MRRQGGGPWARQRLGVAVRPLGPEGLTLVTATGLTAAEASTDLPSYRSVLAVCAHPDDESFGLGAALARFCELGSTVSVLCFTHGEASTLGNTDDTGLGALRQGELASAAAVLGARALRLLSYPDGQLGGQPAAVLARDVVGAAHEAAADLLVVFDEGGVTGHEDHQAATRAALVAAASLGLPVLAWAIETTVAEQLNSAFAAGFVGRARWSWTAT